MKYFLCLSPFFFFISVLDAQTFLDSIVGRVVDSETNVGLEGATLYLVNLGLGTCTDTNGYFRINYETPISPNDSLIVSHLGFAPAARKVMSFQEDNQIALDAVAYNLNGVVVSGKDFKIRDFMHEVVKNYNDNKRGDPHIARSYYYEFAKQDGRFISFMESLGYSFYLSLPKNVSPLANFNFFCDNVRAHFSSKDWLHFGMSDTSVPFSSASTLLNCFRVFETKGVLYLPSISRYTFALESKFRENNRDLFMVSFKGRGDKGTIVVDAKSLKIIRMYGSTRSLFSTVFHRRIDAKFSFVFMYFASVPFVSRADARYEHNGVYHEIKYANLVQKLDDFQVSSDEFWALNNNSPLITYDSKSFKRDAPEYLQRHIAYDQIEKDLLGEKESLESYFKKEIDPWLHDREGNYGLINNRLTYLRDLFIKN